jgi:hypothetical protein
MDVIPCRRRAAGAVLTARNPGQLSGPVRVRISTQPSSPSWTGGRGPGLRRDDAGGTGCAKASA